MLAFSSRPCYNTNVRRERPYERRIWGYSSAGRALEWHSRGQRFDPAYLHQNIEDIRKDVLYVLVKVGLGENRRSNKRISFAPAKAPLWRRDGAAVQIHSVREGRSPGVSRLSPHGLIKARCNCSALSSQGGRLCRNGRPQAAAQSAARWDGGQRSGRPTQEGELNSSFFAEHTL